MKKHSMTSEEKAYLAGIIDGEGTITLKQRSLKTAHLGTQ